MLWPPDTQKAGLKTHVFKTPDFKEENPMGFFNSLEFCLQKSEHGGSQ
jgi:hypothetical protein